MVALDGYVQQVDLQHSLSSSLQQHTYDLHLASTPPSQYGFELRTSASTSNSCAPEVHVVMVPYPVQGQINPMMQFANLLTARRNDIMVTLVHNKHNYDRIKQTRSFAAASRSSTDSNIHLAWVDSGWLPANFNPSDASESDLRKLRESVVRMKEPLKQLLNSFQRRSPAVSCVLFGTFCPWAQSAAAELGIPNFLFWTQSATMFSIYCHLPLLATSNFFPYCHKKLNVSQVTYIPGLPPLHPSSFPSLLRVDDISDPSLANVREQFSLIESCSGVLINSFEELEKDTWQALQQELAYPVSLVGPLLPSVYMEGDGDDLANKTIGASLLQEKSECITWLDGRQKQTVLYISFGSLFKPSPAELEAIASGIQATKQPYLWVIRPSKSCHDVADILPRGFVEETRGYGLIVPWAPQVQVLSHPAVGAFLTHCGWNSTLESLSMGVPMISYPITLDQPTNGACICEVWKVGTALKCQDDGKLKSEDVARALRTVFQEDEGCQMRERAFKLRDAARQAVQVKQTGSSQAHIHKFVQGLVRHAPGNLPA